MATTEELDAARKFSILKKYAKGQTVSDDDKISAGIKLTNKINRPANYKTAEKSVKANVEGIRTFSVEWGFSLEQIKEVRKTPDGAASVDHGRVDPKKFVRAFLAWMKAGKEGPRSRDEAQMEKLIVETRILE